MRLSLPAATFVTRAALVVFVAIAGLAAIGCGDPAAPMATSVCTRDLDCPADQRCLAGVCKPLSVGGCVTSSDCPAGHQCLASGACQKAECITSDDCCPSGTTCGRTCENFQCFGSECSDGDKRECFVACHRGERVCERGEFQPCDAAPVAPTEACDNHEDDDCNGQTDEGCLTCTAGDEVACTTVCGAGTALCTASGQLGPCSAGIDCTCTPGVASSRNCGKCGHESGTCGADKVYEWTGLCAGEGTCTPEEIETKACGVCGSASRICGFDCVWGEWSECGQEGDCVVGATEHRGCTGACGQETRTCDGACAWGEWSTCDVTGGCTQGEKQTVPCGRCGSRVATCDSSCQWGPFGVCSGEGECEPESIDSEPCGNCGERTRTCDSSCGWSAWGACSGEGECSAGDVGSIVCGPDATKGPCKQGAAPRTCTPACTWGAAGACKGAVYPVEEVCGDGVDQDCNGLDKTLPDEWESNDTCGACEWLGKDPNKTLYATFDQSADEVDYYCFTAVDDFNIVGFGEHIRVNLMNQSSGIDGDIYLYRSTADCSVGPSKAVAKSETLGTAAETIDWSESTGTSDDGLWIIEVHNFEPDSAGCYKAYTLSVNGLN